MTESACWVEFDKENVILTVPFLNYFTPQAFACVAATVVRTDGQKGKVLALCRRISHDTLLGREACRDFPAS